MSCIRRSFHSVWWQHDLFPALCESQKLLSLPLPCVFFKSLFWSFPQAHIHRLAQSSLEEIPPQTSRAHSVSLSASLVFCPENSSHLGLPQFQNLSSELSKTTRLYLDASPGTAACKLPPSWNNSRSPHMHSISVITSFFYVQCCLLSDCLKRHICVLYKSIFVIV